MTTATVTRASLSLGAELGKGGQGRVYAVHGPALGRPTAYKEYRSGTAVTPALPRMIDDLNGFTPEQADDWLDRFAWPLQLVEDGSTISGFLMPAVPDRFYTEWKRTGTGTTTRLLAEFQHLLNPPGFITDRGISLDRRRQYELLASLAESLDLLHAHGLAVGDLSPRNLLFDLTGPAASVYFLDCDAMPYQDGPRHDQVETPGWGVPAGLDGREPLGTPASDAYKFGLLALRLLAGSQDATGLTALPDDAAGLRGLLVRTLDPNPVVRPSPGQWIPSLRVAAGNAATRPVVGSIDRTERTSEKPGKKKKKKKKSGTKSVDVAAQSPPAPPLPDELAERLGSPTAQEDHRDDLTFQVRRFEDHISRQQIKVVSFWVVAGLALVTAIGFLIAGVPGLTILIPVAIGFGVAANSAAQHLPDDDVLEHIGHCMLTLQVLGSSSDICDGQIDLEDVGKTPTIRAYLVVDTPAESRAKFAKRARKALGDDSDFAVEPDTIHLYAPDGSPIY